MWGGVGWGGVGWSGVGWGGVGWGGVGWGGVGVGLLDFHLSTSEHINMNVKTSGDMHSSDCL